MRDHADLAPAESFRLGEWQVFPRLNRIEAADGEARQLEPKVMRVLEQLASRPGEIFAPDELIDAVWGGIAVSPNVLTYSIAALRKALGDDWRSPRYIETISKSGYRLVEGVVHGIDVPLAPTADGGTIAAPRGTVVPGPEAPRGRDRPAAYQPVAVSGARQRRLVAAMIGAAVVIAAIAALGVTGWPLSAADSDVPTAPTVLQSRPVTAMPGFEVNPTLSPDGNHLAFSWRPADRDHYDVHVKLIGAESPALLVGTPGHDLNPAWTPDGLHVVYVTRSPDGGCGIFQIPATGGSSRRLADCPGTPIGNLAVAPDGRRIAIGSATGPGKPTQVFLLDLDSGAVRPVATPPATAQGDYYPRFSPDGSRVSFHRIRGDGLSDLFVADSAGGEPARITFDNRDIGGHDWLRDGEHLLFSSYRTGQFRLWKVAATGGVPEPVAVSDHQMTSLSLARAADRLVYYREISETSFWGAALPRQGSSRADPAASTDAGAAVEIAAHPQGLSSTRWDGHPALSSDAARVAFSSTRSGFFEIWSAAPDGSAAIRHTSFEGPFVGAPRFSPDDRRIVFDARPDGHADLWVADASGSGIERLTGDPGDELAPSFSRDGRWIYFASARGGDWQIWRMAADGGAATRVTGAGGYAAREGPDGALYYTKAGGPGIWRAELDAQGRATDEENVVSGVRVIDWGSWDVGSSGVYFVSRAPEGIARWDPATGRTLPLLALTGTAPRQHPSLAVSTDETFLLFAQIDRSETDVMLVEGLR